MDPTIEHLFIVNATAGRGRTQAILPHLAALLQTQDLRAEMRFTSKPGEAFSFAQRGIQEGYNCIVAVGGDGTVHEVANALVGTPVAMGVIPTGSGNDFCKAADIPLELAKAVEVLARGQRRPVDIARFGQHYVTNGLGIGLDGAVSHRYRRMKYLRGELGYLWAAIHEALTYKAYSLELRTPDWQYSGPALLAGASNGPYQGGNFKLTPEAKVDDGLLDIYVVQDMLPLKRLIQIPKVRKGTHVKLKEVEIRRAPWVEIRCNAPCLAHMDGEPFQLLPGTHRIEVLPRSLQVLSAL